MSPWTGDARRPRRAPWSGSRGRAGLRALALAGVLAHAGLPLAAQDAPPLRVHAGIVEPDPGPVEALHPVRMQALIEREVHGTLLATGGDARDRHLDAAEQMARSFVAQSPRSADAHYWLAVTLGLRTEYGGPVEKLTTGPEVFETAARVLELDPDHPGGHEIMGRLHAAVLRLPWPVRSLARAMGMGDVLGEASWEAAEDHYRRAAAGDPGAIAPRLQLARLLVEQGRPAEAAGPLAEIAAIEPASEVDRRMRLEAAELAGSPGER